MANNKRHFGLETYNEITPDFLYSCDCRMTDPCYHGVIIDGKRTGMEGKVLKFIKILISFPEQGLLNTAYLTTRFY